MKKTLLSVLLILTLAFTACFAVSAADGQITEEIKVLNGAGKTVATYDIIVNNTKVNAETSIQKAVNYCRDNATEKNIHTVRVPEGRYGFYSSLNVYSNTVIDFGGSVILRGDGCGSLVRFGLGSQKTYGYDGYRNVTIKNGTFDAQKKGTSSLVRFAHAYNVEISDIIFKNTLDVKHFLTFAACNKVRVLDCQFLDAAIKEMSSSNNCEAIQIDVLKDEYFNYPAYDGTPTRNVEISGCTFRNVQRGVGTHTAITGYYFDKMIIKNNTFTNIPGYAVKTVNYINSEISGNVITDCGSGICVATVPNEGLGHFYAPMSKDSAVKKKLNVKIYGNSISLKSKGHDNVAFGIRIHGENVVKHKDRDGVTFSADCRVAGVTVENNVINSAINQVSVIGIHIDGANGSAASNESDVKVIKNKINFTNKKASSNRIYGIKVEASNNVYVNGNTVKDLKSGKKNLGIGIITEASKGIIFSGNTVTGTNSYGIRIENTKKSAVSKNTVSGAGNAGVYVYNASADISVASNKLTGCNGGGVYVYKAGASNVKSNTVSKSGECGIIIKNSKGAVVQSNKISSSATVGIYILKSTAKTVASNKVSSSGTEGIYLNESEVEAIKSNTVTGSALNGIYVKKSTAKSITSNKTDKSGSHGIYLNGSTSESIKSNKIYSSSGYSINIDDSKATTLSSNKIYKAPKAAIRIAGTSKATTVSSNYICGGKGTGISLCEKASVSTVSKNKIDLISSKADGIAVEGKAKVGKIESNSINAKTSEESKKLKVKCRYGININSSECKVSKIYKNTIKSCEKSAIYIGRMKAKAKVKITGNKITKAMYGVSYVKGKATVKDNTMKKCSKAKTKVI